MIHRPPNKYIPPKNSNWNLTAPRSSEEAFGYQWKAPVEAPPKTNRWILMIIAVAIAALVVYVGIHG